MARGRGRRGARGRLCRRRHRRVHRRRRRLLFHRDEYAAAGRACGDRGGDRARPRRMAVAGRRRREIAAAPTRSRSEAATRSRRGSMPKTPSADFLPQTGTLHRLRLPPPEIARVDTGVRQGDRGDAVLRPDDRQDHRLGRGPAGGDAAAAPGAGRDRGARPAHQSRVSGAARGRARFRRGCGRHRLYRAPSRGAAPAAPAGARRGARRGGALPACRARGGHRRRGDGFGRPVFALGERPRAGGSAGASRQDLVFRDDAEERTVEATARGPELAAAARRADGRRRRRALQPDGAFGLVLDGVRPAGHACSITAPRSRCSSMARAGGSSKSTRSAGASGEDPAGGRLTAPMPGRVTRLLVEAGSDGAARPAADGDRGDEDGAHDHRARRRRRWRRCGLPSAIWSRRGPS